jgi:hypothetical protein
MQYVTCVGEGVAGLLQAHAGLRCCAMLCHTKGSYGVRNALHASGWRLPRLLSLTAL